MAKSPQDVLNLTPEDEKAVKTLEDYIDNSIELKNFDGYEVKILIPFKLVTEQLGVRKSIRTQALLERFRAAGWKEVMMGGSGEQIYLKLDQYEHRYGGSGRD